MSFNKKVKSSRFRATKLRRFAFALRRMAVKALNPMTSSLYQQSNEPCQIANSCHAYVRQLVCLRSTFDAPKVATK